MPASDINARIQLISLVIIAAILLAGALLWLRPIMVPLVLAVMLSYILAPVVDVLVNRFRVPRVPAIFLVLIIAFCGLFLMGTIIEREIETLAKNAEAYEAHLKSMGTSILAWAEQRGIPFSLESLQQQIQELPIGSLVTATTSSLLNFLSNGFLVLIFVIYLLQGRDPQQRRGPIAKSIEDGIKRYLAIKLVLSMITGCFVGLFLHVIGVELAMVFGVLAFILNFVPNVGSVIATLLPIPMVLVSPDFTMTTLVLALALPGTVQMVVGNVVEPKLLGDSLGLHPISVLLSLIFWGMLWGISGMLLAAPITAVVKILLENLEVTKPVARLLEGELPTEYEGKEMVHHELLRNENSSSIDT